MSVFLGIDIGTSGTKTLAMTEKGKILAEATECYPSYHPKPLWSEQEPEDWWQATVKTIRAVVAKAKLKPADVKGIGLSGQMHGSVFLDKQNRVVRRALLWNDQRTARRMRRNGKAGRRAAQSDQARRQSGPDRLHRTENPLASQPRAAKLCEDGEGAAPQGRCAAAAHRRIRHRSERRQRHVAPGRGQAGLVETTPLETRTRRQLVCQVL